MSEEITISKETITAKDKDGVSVTINKPQTPQPKVVIEFALNTEKKENDFKKDKSNIK